MIVLVPFLSPSLLRHALLALTVGVAGLPGFGCVRSASQEAAEAVTWELSPEAERSYATLMLDQAMRHNDADGVVAAADIFLRLDVPPQSLLEIASWLILNERGEAARRLLEKAAEENGDNLDLRLLLAESLVEAGNNARALEVLRDFQDHHPQSAVARQELGILYVKLGRHKEADELLAGVPEKLRNPFVRYCHARSLAALNRPDAAVRQLRLALKESPEFLDASLLLAETLEGHGGLQEAIRIYSRLLEEHEDNAGIWLHLIEARLKARQPGQALELVRSGPGSFAFQLEAAALFVDAERYDEAETLLVSLSEDPNAPEEVYFFLAALVYEEGRNAEKCLDYLQRVSPANRCYDRALRLRTQILYDEGRKAEALSLVRDGQRQFPGEVDWRLMEAQLLLYGEKRDEALITVDTALKEWPDNRDLLFMRGSVLDLLERKDEALRVMEDLIRRSPDDYQALNYVGYTLAETGQDLDRARQLLERAVELAPDQAYILDSLAWAQFRGGQVAQALETIRRAVALPGSDEPTIWEHYGDIAAAQGRRAEAKKAWTRALKLDSDKAASIRAKLEGQ